MKYSHSIKRKKTKKIQIGNIYVGGDSPITVQTMTNTLTHDIDATLEQISLIEKEGCDIVRVSVPDEKSSQALKKIIPEINIPLVADIHFHYKRAIEAAEAGAACLRINPGNIGNNEKIREVIKAAKDFGCSIRIGINAGSIEKDLLEKYREPCPEALLESAKRNIGILEDNDFFEFKISVKASDVFLAVAAYSDLVTITDAPFHIGITEAGSFFSGTVKSAIGLGNLLWAGLGDTVRVSLSADPVEEVKAGYEILKSLNLRHRGVQIISCPSCARQGFDVIKTVEILEKKLEHIKTPISLSIIGCVVNGPGEALMTDIGFTGGGAGSGMIYTLGKTDHKIDNDKMIDHIVSLVEERAKDLSERQ